MNIKSCKNIQYEIDVMKFYNLVLENDFILYFIKKLNYIFQFSALLQFINFIQVIVRCSYLKG
jgi:hypothetical protein